MTVVLERWSAEFKKRTARVRKIKVDKVIAKFCILNSNKVHQL